MRDLIGERTALEQTRIIIKGIDGREMPKSMYKKLVHTIYEKQLKKFTPYGRLERRKLVKNLGMRSSHSVRSPAPTDKHNHKQRSKEKSSQNTAEQGSQ